MSPDDPDTSWLREQLDRELSGVTSRPAALREVLDRARSRRLWWRRGVGLGMPAWVVAAVAVTLVVLAVPFGVAALRHGPSTQRLAGSAGPGAATSRVPTPSSVPSVPAAAVSPPGSGRTGAPTPRSTTRPSTTPPTATATLAPATCGAVSAPAAPGPGQLAVDVDGDRQPDLVSTTGGLLSVQLTTGGTVGAPLNTASPYVAVLAVQTDASAASELMVVTRGGIGTDGSVGQNATVYGLRDCALGPLLNAQGRPYTFEVGSSASDTRRAGVACRGRTLLGVTSVRDAQGAWTVTSTPVTSTAGRISNGAPTVTSVPASDTATAVQTISCGAAVPQPLG